MCYTTSVDCKAANRLILWPLKCGEPRADPFRVDLAASHKGEAMRYTRLATYDIVKGTFPELTTIAEKGILPVFIREPGFVDYGLVDVGHNKVVAISIWETREEAQKSVTMAATWVRENIADRVRLVTTNVGNLALFHGVPVAA